VLVPGEAVIPFPSQDGVHRQGEEEAMYDIIAEFKRGEISRAEAKRRAQLLPTLQRELEGFAAATLARTDLTFQPLTQNMLTKFRLLRMDGTAGQISVGHEPELPDLNRAHRVLALQYEWDTTNLFTEVTAALRDVGLSNSFCNSIQHTTAEFLESTLPASTVSQFVPMRKALNAGLRMVLLNGRLGYLSDALDLLESVHANSGPFGREVPPLPELRIASPPPPDLMRNRRPPTISRNHETTRQGLAAMLAREVETDATRKPAAQPEQSDAAVAETARVRVARQRVVRATAVREEVARPPQRPLGISDAETTAAAQGACSLCVC
jgi:hypothetical protein